MCIRDRIMGVNSAVTMVLSFSIPWFVRLVGYKTLYYIAMIYGVVCFILPSWSRLMYPTAAMTISAASGIFSAITNCLPFAILGLIVSEEELGLWIGVLNMVQVAAQLVIGFLAGLVMDWCSSWGLGHIAVGLAFGGVLGVLAFPLTYSLTIPHQQPTKRSDTDEQQEQLVPRLRHETTEEETEIE
eukprot:TRINITY_DN2603_c0_g1_i1.p1 TRINITY_DN2603_c0_g1~~TRINITY_DN2603_c0_g1_i1.p1  ORF type:complete len:186 (-),score=21.90 TRINITY_DN2603_c0_g1_i1:24-581(-)